MKRREMISRWAVVFGLCLLAARGQSVSETERARALGHLSDRELSARTAARVVVRLAGTNQAPLVRKSLLASQSLAQQAARQLAPRFSAQHKGVQEASRALTEWQVVSTQTLVMIRTDLHKDGAKVRELNEQYKDAQRSYDRLLRLVRAGDFGDFVHTVKQLREIACDLSWCDTGTTAIDVRAVASLEGAKIDDDVRPVLKAVQEVLDRETLRCALDAMHARCKWARPEYREFAALLNMRRSVVALRPLLLGERLCDAAWGHSDEMIKLRYFAHESPVEANKSPWDRTKNAKFEGSAAGECIFAGSESPESAFGGWWGSDGHRFIMFGDDINALGLGRAGGTWTLLTGKFSAFPL